jgi:putative transposase
MAICRWLSGQSTWRPRERGRKKGAQTECVGPNPTDRAKSGVKKSVLVEGNGRPLAVAISGANIPDGQLLKATLEAVVVERPAATEAAPQHLCLDKGYDNAPAETIVREAGYVPHIRRIGEEKLDDQHEKTNPARRWVVERTFAWLSRCRAILVRYDKLAERYLATVKLAAGLLWFRRWYELDPALTF